MRKLAAQNQLQHIIEQFQAIEGVEIASLSLRTQTILLTYACPQQRAAIMQIAPISAQAITPDILACSNSVKKTNTVLIKMVNLLCYGLSRKLILRQGNPVNPIPSYLLRKFLLPPPLRYAWAILSAVPYVVEGIATLSKRKLTVPVLDASALVSAFLQRDYTSIGTITFLFALSQYLEYFTHKKSRQDLAIGLKMLENHDCWLLKNGTETKVPLASVQPGDLLILRSGDEIPVDGTIVEGDAMINQAAMTGESMPQHRTVGGWLHAGTAIEEGSVLLKAVKVHGQTKISRIIEFIDQAEELKAGIQMQAETRADALVPYSFAGAGLVGLLTRDSRKASSVLMVDYSCAIRLSTPLSILSAMRSGVNNGLLIKGGKFLEALAQADTLVFDKTGTLSKATPQVTQIVPFCSAYDNREILRLAACLEEHFPHPLGRAVVLFAEQQQLKHREEHAKVEYIAAHGIVSKLNGKRVLLGSQHFLMEDEGIMPSEEISRQMGVQAALGRSLLYLAIDSNIVGMLAISDPPREEAEQVIQQLKHDGLQVHMLTGDSPETARAVAMQLGIEQYGAQMLPAEKAAYLQKLKNLGHKIIMVGDGINDSPALALANVGVTLQDGSDLARNVADVVLTRNNLSDLLLARNLGKQALGRIQHNYVGIVAINTLLLVLGIGGAITPSSSALLHNASTILSALNSMRPYRLV